MKRRFFSGSSLDQAVMAAARHYEVEPGELAYRQIEKKHGFLRTRRAVMIAVEPEQPRRQPDETSGSEAEQQSVVAAQAGEVAAAEEPEETPEPTEDRWEPAVAAEEGVEQVSEPEPQPWEEPGAKLDTATDLVEDEPARMATTEPAPEAAPEPERSSAPEPEASISSDHDDELLDAAEDATEMLMNFAGIEAGASADSGGERVEVEIEGPDASLLVVEDGKGLLAIQHLLPRMLRGMTGRSSFVRVDSQEFHQKRRERLEALAAKEAEAASRSGRPRTLPPMAPDERRIVHLALKDSPAVVTESRGSGLHKRVVVRPVAGDGGSDDIEARHGF